MHRPALGFLCFRTHSPAVTDVWVIADDHGNQFLFSIAVIDLDPKPFDKFPTYIEDDRRVVDYYMCVIDKKQHLQPRKRQQQQQQKQQQQRWQSV